MDMGSAKTPHGQNSPTKASTRPLNSGQGINPQRKRRLHDETDNQPYLAMLAVLSPDGQASDCLCIDEHVYRYSCAERYPAS